MVEKGGEGLEGLEGSVEMVEKGLSWWRKVKMDEKGGERWRKWRKGLTCPFFSNFLPVQRYFIPIQQESNPILNTFN